ncbi:MAG: endonuclease domain-containing protein [Candidatus Moraniibacteriota bacterium]
MPADRKTILKSRARTLRKTMTEAEIRIWNQLRRRQINGLRFLRQHPLGKYIVDFYCPSEKLAIEIDGGQHYESGESVGKDRERDNFLLHEYGIRTLRFTNIDVMQNMSAVIDRILEETSVN